MGGYVSSYITEAHRKTVRGDEMALERFIILLDNADAAYFPGQTVTGVVHIWNGRTKTLKGWSWQTAIIESSVCVTRQR